MSVHTVHSVFMLFISKPCNVLRKRTRSGQQTGLFIYVALQNYQTELSSVLWRSKADPIFYNVQDECYMISIKLVVGQ